MTCCYFIEMTKYRLICPRCGASIIAATREEVTWEVCPACHRHVWDLLDSRMAEPVNGQQNDPGRPHFGHHGKLLQ